MNGLDLARNEVASAWIACGREGERGTSAITTNRYIALSVGMKEKNAGELNLSCFHFLALFDDGLEFLNLTLCVLLAIVYNNQDAEVTKQKETGGGR